MRRLLFISLLVVGFYSCCKEACMDEGLQVVTKNLQAVDTDTVYLIKYKAGSRFNERIDTIKRYEAIPAGSTLPSTFIDFLDYTNDWKVVIPALNKEYFISNFETEKEGCSCEGGTYRVIKKFRFNSTEVEGNRAVLD